MSEYYFVYNNHGTWIWLTLHPLCVIRSTHIQHAFQHISVSFVVVCGLLMMMHDRLQSCI